MRLTDCAACLHQVDRRSRSGPGAMATSETWTYSLRGNELCSYRLYVFAQASDPFDANRFQQRSIPSLPYNRHLLRLLHYLLIE